MNVVHSLFHKLIPTGPVLLLITNWYGGHAVLIYWVDHDTAVCIKYAMTGIISFLFALGVIYTPYYRNRLWVNITLFFALGLAFLQLYYMVWNLAHVPWPAFKLPNFPKYLEMIQRLNVPYMVCSTFPAVVILKLIYIVNQKLSKKDQDPKNMHGSARFATPKEVKKLNQKRGILIGLVPRSDRTQEPEEFVADVQSQNEGEILRLNPHHMVLIAPSGSGKGVGIVIPTILDYPGPLVITDIKEAENFYVTARHRRSLGKETYVFDPDGATPQKSVSVNVLDYLDPTSDKIVDDVGILTSIIRPIPKEHHPNAKFFAESAMAILQCLILYRIFRDDKWKEFV